MLSCWLHSSLLLSTVSSRLSSKGKQPRVRLRCSSPSVSDVEATEVQQGNLNGGVGSLTIVLSAESCWWAVHPENEPDFTRVVKRPWQSLEIVRIARFPLTFRGDRCWFDELPSLPAEWFAAFTPSKLESLLRPWTSNLETRYNRSIRYAIAISIREKETKWDETRSYQILLAQPALLPSQRAVSNHAAVVANDRFLQQRGRWIVERFPWSSVI